jgi:hypothetical protein
MESVAVALAMTGDVSGAQAIADDLGHRFPDDTLLHQGEHSVRASVDRIES